MLTKQQIFDRVATHLLTQRKVSVGPFGYCLYRDPDGLKCAVGCLIEDDEYSSGIEGKSILALRFKNIADSNIKFVLQLQLIHDEQRYSIDPIHLVNTWYSQLRILAINEHLSPAILDQFNLE